MKKWAGRLIKVGFFFAAIIAIMLTVLVNMGGSTNTLKFAIEDYITQTTGMAARVGTLRQMTFFPAISVDAEGIMMKHVDTQALKAWAEAEQAKPEEEQGKTMPPTIDFSTPDGSIGKFMLSMGFWDVSFGLGRSVRNIRIENVYLKPGVFSHKAVSVKIVEIDETPEGKPFFKVEGQLGDDVFQITVDLVAQGAGKSRKYKVGEESHFKASINEIGITGILRPRTMGGFHARDVVITNNDKEVIQATLSFVRNTDKAVDLKGQFKVLENGSNGDIDWSLGRANVEGDIAANELDFADFGKDSELAKLWTLWNQTFKNPQQASEAEASTLSVTAKKAKDNAEEMLDWQGSLTIENNDFNFQKTQ